MSTKVEEFKERPIPPMHKPTKFETESTTAVIQDAQGRAPPSNLMSIEELKEAFNAYDANANGELDMIEASKLAL